MIVPADVVADIYAAIQPSTNMEQQLKETFGNISETLFNNIDTLSVKELLSRTPEMELRLIGKLKVKGL